MLKIHPIADDLPPLSDAEYQELVDDIEKNGCLTPILVDEDGMVIDGRHRMRACEELGIGTPTRVFNGSDEAKREYSYSLNDVRRHLSESQRAMRHAARVTVVNGTNQFAGKKGTSRDVPSHEKVTIADAAKDAKVGRATIERAKIVVEKGIPEVQAAVMEGKLKINAAAKIASMTKAEQKKAAAKGFKVESKRRAKPKEEPVTPAQGHDTGDRSKIVTPAPGLGTGDMQAIGIAESPAPSGPPAGYVELAKYIENEMTCLMAWAMALDEWDAFADRKKAAKRVIETMKRLTAEYEAHIEPVEPQNNARSEATNLRHGHDVAKKSPPKQPRSRIAPTDAEFDEFYAAFPRRVNKAKSKIAFAKAFKLLCKTHEPDEVISVIMTGVAVYAEHADPEVLCHPSTWLNGCRWEDEAESIGRGLAGIKGGKERAAFGKYDPKDNEMSLEEQIRYVNSR